MLKTGTTRTTAATVVSCGLAGLPLLRRMGLYAPADRMGLLWSACAPARFPDLDLAVGTRSIQRFARGWKISAGMALVVDPVVDFAASFVFHRKRRHRASVRRDDRGLGAGRGIPTGKFGAEPVHSIVEGHCPTHPAVRTTRTCKSFLVQQQQLMPRLKTRALESSAKSPGSMRGLDNGSVILQVRGIGASGVGSASLLRLIHPDAIKSFHSNRTYELIASSNEFHRHTERSFDG